MDVMKRLEDLMNLALDGSTSEHERLNAALGALRLIRQYGLLGKKRVDVAVEVLDRFTSPDFVEGVAVRAEKFAGSVGRVVGSIRQVGDALSRARVGEVGQERRRVRRRR